MTDAVGSGSAWFCAAFPRVKHEKPASLSRAGRPPYLGRHDAPNFLVCSGVRPHEVWVTAAHRPGLQQLGAHSGSRRAAVRVVARVREGSGATCTHQAGHVNKKSPSHLLGLRRNGRGIGQMVKGKATRLGLGIRVFLSSASRRPGRQCFGGKTGRGAVRSGEHAGNGRHMPHPKPRAAAQLCPVIPMGT